MFRDCCGSTYIVVPPFERLCTLSGCWSRCTHARYAFGSTAGMGIITRQEHKSRRLPWSQPRANQPHNRCPIFTSCDTYYLQAPKLTTVCTGGKTGWRQVVSADPFDGFFQGLRCVFPSARSLSLCVASAGRRFGMPRVLDALHRLPCRDAHGWGRPSTRHRRCTVR